LNNTLKITDEEQLPLSLNVTCINPDAAGLNNFFSSTS